MAYKSVCMVLALLFMAVSLPAQWQVPADAYPTSAFENIHLKYTGRGQAQHFTISGKSRFIVYVFLSPECPLSQQYTLSLNQLANNYHGAIEVIGIFPGRSYDQATINSFIQKYKLRFATYIDESKQLTNLLGATVTPEVILVKHENDRLAVQYRGAIDDRVKSLGVKRLKASNYFLKEAVEQSLQDKSVVIKRTDPVGCLINDY